MKQNIRRTPILQYAFIVVLIGILITGVLYLFTHARKTQILQANIAKLIANREGNDLIDSCIINLYSADNYSRLYAVTGDKSYLNKFSNVVTLINNAISKLKSNQNSLSGPNSAKLRDLLSKKSLGTDTYIKLRRLTDSLISNAANVAYAPLPAVAEPELKAPIVKIEHKITYDTIKKQDSVKPKKKLFGRLIAAISKKKQPENGKNVTVPETVIIKNDQLKNTASNVPINDKITVPPKKKLFGRLIAAFSKKKQPEIETSVPVPETVITKNDQVTTLVSDIRSNDKIKVQTPAHINYKTINQANTNLRKNEVQALMINNSLIDEIIGELKGYKAAEQNYIEYSKNELKVNITAVSFESEQMSIFALLILILLTLLVFYNIWKIFRNEQRILKYSKQTELYAQSKSRFLAGMSHEIRTPLNSIVGFSELLDQEDLQPAHKEQVAAIKNSSEMLMGLVNDILDFTKYETGKTSFENAPFIVNNVFAEVYRTMQIQASKKRLSLDNLVTIDKSLWCEGDSRRLKQVLINLLGNAIKFTVNGSVTLKASIETGAKSTVILKVQIADSGLGIAAADLPLIFEEFTQVGSAQKVTEQKGTGLGLPICKKIIELQGGHISVSSQVGKGSVFSFDLPLVKTDLIPVEDSRFFSDDEMAELLEGRRILLVEDNPLNVLLGRTILKKWKTKYDVAYNGLEGFELFENNYYDVVITDIQMPEMDGLQLAELIRGHADSSKSNVPIIALTASVLEEEKDIFFNAGFNYIVLKPFKEKDLVEKISFSIQTNLAVLDV